MAVVLTLVRGVPGSGKSTMAKAIAKETKCIHLEADMFFLSTLGEYMFDPSKIKLAHEWCHQQARQALSSGQSVVVSNTFVKRWEMQAYLRMAEEYGVQINVIVATGCYGNLHSVPDAVVQRMRDNWEA